MSKPSTFLTYDRNDLFRFASVLFYNKNDFINFTIKTINEEIIEFHLYDRIETPSNTGAEKDDLLGVYFKTIVLDYNSNTKNIIYSVNPYFANYTILPPNKFFANIYINLYINIFSLYSYIKVKTLNEDFGIKFNSEPSILLNNILILYNK